MTNVYSMQIRCNINVVNIKTIQNKFYWATEAALASPGMDPQGFWLCGVVSRTRKLAENLLDQSCASHGCSLDWDLESLFVGPVSSNNLLAGLYSQQVTPHWVFWCPSIVDNINVWWAGLWSLQPWASLALGAHDPVVDV